MDQYQLYVRTCRAFFEVRRGGNSLGGAMTKADSIVAEGQFQQVQVVERATGSVLYTAGTFTKQEKVNDKRGYAQAFVQFVRGTFVFH